MRKLVRFLSVFMVIIGGLIAFTTFINLGYNQLNNVLTEQLIEKDQKLIDAIEGYAASLNESDKKRAKVVQQFNGSLEYMISKILDNEQLMNLQLKHFEVFNQTENENKKLNQLMYDFLLSRVNITD